jgi:chromate transport protein ChrA
MLKGKVHPILFYGVLGVLSALVIFVQASIVPLPIKDLEANKRLIQAILFTISALVIWSGVFWKQRDQGSLWLGLCILLVFHVLCVYLYSHFVQPILVWQWALVLFVESYAAIPFIDWFMRRVSRSGFEESRT